MLTHSGSRWTLVLYLVILVSSVLATFTAQATERSVLTLAEAERLALDQDPLTRVLQSRAMGLAEQAIADGQLPDPQLRLGIANLPVDSFSRTRDDMTMLEFGLQQSFPPGRSLQYRREYGEALSEAEMARSNARELEVIREVRLRYLDVYYQQHALKLLHENREVFKRLVDITERQFAAGRDVLQDVLRAQLELTLIEDRIVETERAREAGYAELGRYISAEHVGRPLDDVFPELPSVSAPAEFDNNFVRHPLLQVEDANINAAAKRVAEAEQLYWPGFSVNVGYAFRDARMPAGDRTPDLLSAMFMIDLPLFRDKRQDRRLAAAQSEHQSAQFARTDRWRELDSFSRREYANWQRLGERMQLYEKRALDDARMNVEASLKAYQADVTDFTTLMRAQLSELQTQLELLRLRIERAQAQARLLYLVRGES